MIRAWKLSQKNTEEIECVIGKKPALQVNTTVLEQHDVTGNRETDVEPFKRKNLLPRTPPRKRTNSLPRIGRNFIQESQRDAKQPNNADYEARDEDDYCCYCLLKCSFSYFFKLSRNTLISDWLIILFLQNWSVLKFYCVTMSANLLFKSLFFVI